MIHETKILKRLLEIERNLSMEPENPAYNAAQGGVRVDVGEIDAAEIIKIIGQWSYDKRQAERIKLENEKAKLKAQLYLNGHKEVILSAICQFTQRNTQSEIIEVERWIDTEFRK